MIRGVIAISDNGLSHLSGRRNLKALFFEQPRPATTACRCTSFAALKGMISKNSIAPSDQPRPRRNVPSVVKSESVGCPLPASCSRDPASTSPITARMARRPNGMQRQALLRRRRQKRKSPTSPRVPAVQRVPLRNRSRHQLNPHLRRANRRQRNPLTRPQQQRARRRSLGQLRLRHRQRSQERSDSHS